jgi:tetratricopeptide (TPR) repeat protein
VTVFALAWRSRARRWVRVLGVGVGWVLLAALPTSPWVGPANEQADRYALLPSFGAALAWVALGRLALPPRWRVPLFGVAALAALGASVAGSLVYRDELTLFEEAVARAPEAAPAWSGLAYVLRHRGELARARQAADTACRLAPRSTRVRLTRAYVLLEQGEEARARADLDWVRAQGGAGLPGMQRALDCLERPNDERRDCLHHQVTPP